MCQKPVTGQTMKQGYQLSLFSLIMVVIGSCIGIGIFLTPAFVAGHLPHPGWILIVWTAGGLSALSAALTLGEIASRFPDKDGIYYWLKVTYGDFWGFLFGWFYMIVLVSGAIAAIGLGFAHYAMAYLPGYLRSLNEPGIAICLIGLICLINCLGLRWGDLSTGMMALLKTAGLLLIIFLGFKSGRESPSLLADLMQPVGEPGLARGFGMALVGVSFSYAGVQYATFLATESSNSARNTALAMTIGIVITGVLYVLTNYSLLLMLPVGEIAGSGSPVSDAVALSGGFFASIVPPVIMISAAGTIAAFTLAAPRMYRSMAEDGMLFTFLMRVHPRSGVPVNSILFQSGFAVFWVLFWGTFADVITHLVLTNLLFMVMASCCVYILRRRMAGRPESGFTVPGYPVVPAIYILVSCYIIFHSSIHSPRSLLVTGLFILAGWGVYHLFIVKHPV